MVPRTPKRKLWIWRDDDVLDNGTVDDLLRIDDLFQTYGLTHTLAVLAETVLGNDALVKAVVERKMRVQLHGWRHDDHSVDRTAVARIPEAKRLLEETFGQAVTVFYPPWNRTSDYLERACAGWGLTVSYVKMTIKDFIARRDRYPGIDTVNFHYWAPECARLDEALRICAELTR